jgi:hypothetical protein
MNPTSKLIFATVGVVPESGYNRTKEPHLLFWSK